LFSIFGHQTLDPDPYPDSLEVLDPDHYPDPQHWFKVYMGTSQLKTLMPLISFVTRGVLLERSRSLKRAIERRFLLLPLLLLTGGLGAGDPLAGLHKHHPVLALRNKFSNSQMCGYVTDSFADPDRYVFGPPNPDPLVRGTDPDPDPVPDSSIIKQK
jgi:hypothetical protein